jgi:hypothetical protein
MPKVNIQRYANGENSYFEILVPTRVTRTGDEDHFRRACEDADLIVMGMREMEDRLAPEDKGRFRIVSVALD